ASPCARHLGEYYKHPHLPQISGIQYILSSPSLPKLFAPATGTAHATPSRCRAPRGHHRDHASRQDTSYMATVRLSHAFCFSFGPFPKGFTLFLHYGNDPCRSQIPGTASSPDERNER
ncbi:MAG: hypothetical protein ABIN58_12845, partial [candidate division WOR-3 bacterium]